MSDLLLAKRELRIIMQEKRSVLSSKNPQAAHQLRDNFLAHISLPSQAVIASYMAQKSEMNPTPLTDALRSQGFRIALPFLRARSKPLGFRLYNPGDDLVAGVMNIPEPSDQAEVVVPDLLLVPLLAFNKQGYRLGYGGGFYDRTLTELRQTKTIIAVGIGYQGQEVASLPCGSHDAKLDKIVTEIQVFSP